MSEYKFASVLKRLEIDKSTGSLVCVGEDSMFARVYVVDGKPRAARCRNLQGKEALVQLQVAELTSVKYYDKVNLIKSDSDDSDIGGFVAEEGEAAAEDLGSVELPSESDIDRLVDTTDDRAHRQNRLSAPDRSILVEELVEYVGPVAEMVVDGLGEDIGVMDAVKLLANEIGDKQMAKQFIEKVKQRL